MPGGVPFKSLAFGRVSCEHAPGMNSRPFRNSPDFKKKAAAWALVAAWAVVLFLSIPFARAAQGAIERWAGTRIYLAAMIVLGAGCGVAMLAGLVRGARNRIARRVGGLILVGVLSAGVLLTQLQTSAEAIHFLEYGLLGFLLFRAWRLHVADPLVYPISALSLGLVAWLDEFLQWLMPGRFWDFRDIRLNAMAGAIVLLSIALVFPPPEIHGPVARRSVRRLCRLAWAMLLALGLAISNTPARVDGYAARISWLHFLRNNESVMNEFGHRHVDAGIGTFFSRLTRAELLRIDGARGAEVGAALLRHHALIRPKDFRKTFTVSADPFQYEVFRRLIQRDHYYAASGQYRETDPARYRHHLAVALHENQLLEKYFPQALDAAGCRWDAARQAHCAEGAEEVRPYVSEVNDHLATGMTEMEWWLVLWTLAGGVGWGYARWGKEP